MVQAFQVFDQQKFKKKVPKFNNNYYYYYPYMYTYREREPCRISYINHDSTLKNNNNNKKKQKKEKKKKKKAMDLINSWELWSLI